MKLFVILSSLFLAIGIGVIGGFFRTKPMWVKVFTLVVLAVGSLLTLYPRTSANLGDADYYAKYASNRAIPYYIKVMDGNYIKEDGHSFGYINVSDPDNEKIIKKMYLDQKNYEHIKTGNTWIVKTMGDSLSGTLKLHEIVQADPWIHYPFILSLEDRIKILNFHVPMAWIAVLSYLIAMIYSVKYLRTSERRYDISAASAAGLGTVFAILATVSGMIWAKFNWGSFWNWDPRETSIFILLLIYFAYFALRSAIEREDIRGRSAAVYSIIAFVTVPFLVFVMPRITAGLHPGAQGDQMGGPILNTSKGMLDSHLLFAYGLCMLGFTLLYFWMLNISIRTNLLKKHIEG